MPNWTQDDLTAWLVRWDERKVDAFNNLTGEQAVALAVAHG